MATKDLKTRFIEEIAPKLKIELGVKNVNAVPRLKKVTLNIGIGSIIQKQGKDFSHVEENLAKIAGQKAVITKSKKAISNFKIREGVPVGLMVTLRGKRMYDFVNKLVNITLPRVRDFRGLSPKSFDGKGGYSIGFKEHVVFPEINPDDVLQLHGVQITISTTAKDDTGARALLKALNFPFKTN
ncbi:MAG: 50S ribosomal protein L5 [Candidatus Gracilibacteria bacterium]